MREWAGRAELMRYEVGEVTAVHYAEVATALGAARFAERTGDAGARRRSSRERWSARRELPNSANHVDANVVGVWPLLLGDPAGEGLALADGQWRETDETGLTRQARFWIDDIWMIGALQAEAWRRTREPRFLDRAALTANAYLARLQQPSGLFHHGPEAPFVWGRGNGWVAAGLAEILSILPQDHPRQGAGARGLPADDGRAARAPAAFGPVEPAGRPARRLGRDQRQRDVRLRLPARGQPGPAARRPYRAAALRAWAGLSRELEPDGRLRGVCVGTGQSADAQYYLDRPVVTGDLHGQAALLWTAAELRGARLRRS